MNLKISPKLVKAFDILGKRWTGLIIAALDSGPHRPEQILELIPKLNKSVLLKRLKELSQEGIVASDLSPESYSQREYELTQKGQALRTVMCKLYDWANIWIEDDNERHRQR